MKTALLVIDVQQALCAGEHAAYGVEALVERINALSARAHEAGAPVVFIQHGAAAGLFQRGTPGWELATGLNVGPDDVVLPKTTPDAFLRTDLEELLKSRGITELVICGLQSEFCVDTTTRRALALGYPVVLVADGHSTLDGGPLTAAQIIQHHNTTLSSISSFGPWVQPVAAAAVQFRG